MAGTVFICLRPGYGFWSASGRSPIMRIHADPDPIHCGCPVADSVHTANDDAARSVPHHRHQPAPQLTTQVRLVTSLLHNFTLRSGYKHQPAPQLHTQVRLGTSQLHNPKLRSGYSPACSTTPHSGLLYAPACSTTPHSGQAWHQPAPQLHCLYTIPINWNKYKKKHQLEITTKQLPVRK